MGVRVLVPAQSKKLFEQQHTIDFEPIFYWFRNESIFQRVMRRLRPYDVRQILDARFKIVAGANFLSDVHAVWLSSEVQLPSSTMTSFLDLLPGLKWVYSQRTGTDHLDLKLFMRRGVLVSNTGQLQSRRVAEMVLACILAHAKKLPKHFAMQRKLRSRSLPCDDVCEQTVGIIGTGNIGGEVARLASTVGMRVIGASRNPERFSPDLIPYHQVVGLNDGLSFLLAQSDHVVLALPLTEDTYGLVGKRELNQMKPNASLINVARGAIVDEEELCQALVNGTIGAAYIDVPARFPPHLWSRLYRTPNLVLTNNSSANNVSVLEEAFNQFIDGLTALIRTGEPPNRVA